MRPHPGSKVASGDVDLGMTAASAGVRSPYDAAEGCWLLSGGRVGGPLAAMRGFRLCLVLGITFAAHGGCTGDDGGGGGGAAAAGGGDGGAQGGGGDRGKHDDGQRRRIWR